MMKNILRGISQDRLYTSINFISLSLAIASCLVLGLYLRQELTYDRHHLNHERIYRVATEWTTTGHAERVAGSSPHFAPLLVQDFPEIEAYVRFLPLAANWETGADRLIRHRDTAFYWKNVYLADDNVFEVFTHEIIHGDARTALVDPSSAAVSRSFARKYFGDANPLGEVITLENGQRRTITLVFADLPANTHLKYDVLFSYNAEAAPTNPVERAQGLFAATDYTYLVMPRDYDAQRFAGLADTFFARHMSSRAREIHVDRWHAWLQPLADIHLYSDVNLDLPTGNRYYLLGLAAAVVFLLVAACINHVNLGTATAVRRAREIGTRRVLGATRRALALEYLGASTLLALIAFAASLLIVEVVVPLTPIASWLGHPAALDPLRDPLVVAMMFAFSIVVGVLSGLYPALYLSSLPPLTAITAVDKHGDAGFRLREILVLVQFTIAACVIACVLLMAAQMSYVADRPLGFEEQGRVVVTLRGTDLIAQIPAIEQELVKNERIRGVTWSDAMIGGQLPAGFMDVENNAGSMEGVLVHHLPVAPDFIDVLGIQIVRGRNFSPDVGTDLAGTIIVNEALVRLMNWREPLGKRLGRRGRQVIGVVGDFNFKSLHTPVEPLVMYQNARPGMNLPPERRPLKEQYLVLSLETRGLGDTLGYIRTTLRRFDSRHPFEYHFVDDALNGLYLSEQRLTRLIGLFSGICIFVACLGLFGLSTFATARRTKEIGIRKVLGASTSQVVLLLSQRTLVLVAVGSVFGWALAYLAMQAWLSAFAYRVRVGPTTFVAASAIVALLALLTVALQSLRTARTRPSESLRYE